MASSELRANAKFYVYAVVLAGAAAIADSFYQLYTRPVEKEWAILALLTLGTGSATVRLPSVPATITVSETFVFASVLLFGAAAGTLTVTLDALVISFWLARKGVPFYRVLFNVGVLPVAMWLGAHLFYALAGVPPLSVQETPVRQLLWPLFVFTITYFSLNSGLIAIAISLEKGGSPFKIWRENFAWLSVNYFCGASVAVLLGSLAKNLDFTSLALIIPLLLVLYLTFTASMGRVEDANRHLSQLNSLYMSTIETLAMAIDAKDQITHGHIRRVQHYAVSLAKATGIREEAQLRAIEAAALLHDMGKLAVPEYILNKPSALTPAEFEKMKLHASVGADILSSIEFPYPVVPIVRHHHESWDGSGYPDGLKGAEIPIGARILSVVDCFDALTSDRPYRPRLSDVDAIRILEERRGRMYDPFVVDCFLRIHPALSQSDLPVTSNRTAFAAITEASSQPAMPSSEVSRLEDISASTEEMLTLYELAKGLSGHTALDDAGDVIFKHLRRILPASTCVFFVYDIETDELVAAHAAGEHSHIFQGLRIVLGQRLTGWVAANRQTIINSDPVLDLGEVSRNLRPRLRSCLSTPLLVRTELVGVLSLYSTARDSFSEDHRRIVESISGQVGQAVRKSIDYESSRPSRLRDGVTGLPQLDHVKNLVVPLAGGETVYPFSLILVRVNNLAMIRSELGTAGAHGLLEGVVTSMRKVLGSTDVLCRCSDEEFVALFLNTDSQTCSQVADRLDSTLKTEVPGIRESSQTHYATRVSHATAPQDGTMVDDLLTVSRQRIQPTSKRSESSLDKGKSIH